MKFFFLTTLLAGWLLVANGQLPIKGIVTRQSDGKPVPGASVYFENTSAGTVTDNSGVFSLIVPAGIKEAQKLVVSHVGFQTHVQNIAAGSSPLSLTITLDEKKTLLQEVVVTAGSKNGWRTWGQLFTDLFIGTSAYARHCHLMNKDVLRFVYSRATNTLRVYASEPLVLENQSLGFSIRVDLEQFSYEFNKKYLFYEIHTFYQQLQAESNGDLKKWEKNRSAVYWGSPLHFFRFLFDSSYAKQGFEIHRLITANRFEWDRVSALYQDNIDSAGNKSTIDFEKRLSKDSLKYYHTILTQGPPAETTDPEPVRFYEFVSIKDSFTVVLHFTGRLSVMYTRNNAPAEYLMYTGVIAPPGQPVKQTNPALLKPVSIIELTEQVPVEVYKNGAVKNEDLLIDGYFAWWNKMATSLPFDYKPPTVLPGSGHRKTVSK